MNERCDENTCGYARETVACHSRQNGAHSVACHFLQTFRHHFHAIEEEAYCTQQGEEIEK